MRAKSTLEPRKWPINQQRKVARELADQWQFDKLRSCQELNEQQIVLSHKLGLSVVLENLRVMAKVYAMAIDIQQFPE